MNSAEGLAMAVCSAAASFEVDGSKLASRLLIENEEIVVAVVVKEGEEVSACGAAEGAETDVDLDGVEPEGSV